jgi:hypothetical protein
MTTKFQYDVFLSHTQADKPRVRRLAERLREAGLRLWFDEWELPVAARTPTIPQPSTMNHQPIKRLERSTVGRGDCGSRNLRFRDPANAGRRFLPLLLADCKLPEMLRRLGLWPT